MDKHLCPENVPNMAVPSTNPEVWGRGHQVADNATQRVQTMQVHALSELLSIINLIGNSNGGLTETHLSTLMDATRLLTMPFASLMQVHKELIQNSTI